MSSGELILYRSGNGHSEIQLRVQGDIVWMRRNNVDRLLEFNERDILDGAGSVSAQLVRRIAQKRNEQFDAQRRRDDSLEADAEHLRELEALERRAEDRKME